MTEHRYPRRAAQKTKSSPYQNVLYWEQLTPDGEIAIYYDCGVKSRSCWGTFDKLLADNESCDVREVFDHHQTPPAPVHRWPRRAVRPSTGIKYLEQATPESRLMIIPNIGEPFRSAYLTVDELLADRSRRAVETFDHHDQTVTLPLTQALQQVDELSKKVTALEVELYRKNQLVDGLRKDIAARDERIATLTRQCKSLSDANDGYRKDLRESSEHLGRCLGAISCAAMMDTESTHAANKDIKQGNPVWSPAFDDTMRRTAECIRLRKELSTSHEFLGRAHGDLARLRRDRDEWERKYNDIKGEDRLNGVGTALHNIKADCERTFYAVGPYDPIVPKFILPHETYGSAVQRLAQNYIMVRNERDTLRNNESRSNDAAKYANKVYDALRYALNDIVKFARRKPTETDLDVVQRVFGERDALDQTIQKMRDALK